MGRGRRLNLWALAVALMVGAAVPGWAQAPIAPQPACPPVRDAQGNLVGNPSCGAGTPTAPAARRFPYPGETTPADTPTPVPSDPAVPQTQAPLPQAGEPASKRFPYPGETNAPGAGVPGAGVPGTGSAGRSPLQDAGSSGESSSGDSSSSSSSSSSGAGAGEDGEKARANDPDANDPAAIPRSKRHKLPPVPRQNSSEREQEDVQVAGFYFNDGNFKGSYDRAKDAVTLDGEDPAAQLALGNAARKLGRLDEAEKAYTRCLALDPVPKVRKPAEKALREMTGGF